MAPDICSKSTNNEMTNNEIVTANNMKLSEYTHKETIMTEARKWVGLQPIGTHHVCHFTTNKVVDTIEEMNVIKFANAREEASQEFFTMEMNFLKNQIKIQDTKLSNSARGPIMWVKISEPNCQLVFRRSAQIQKGKAQKFTILNQIPSEFWSQFRTVEKNCWKA